MISESLLVLVVPKPASGNLVVAALKVVERSNHLNEGLEESFFRIAWRKPHRFPVFVCFEESTRIEAVQPLP